MPGVLHSICHHQEGYITLQAHWGTDASCRYAFFAQNPLTHRSAVILRLFCLYMKATIIMCCSLLPGWITQLRGDIKFPFLYWGHSTLSVAFGKNINLGDTFWISEIRFQYTGPISRDNKAIDYIFGICHYHVSLSTFYEFWNISDILRYGAGWWFKQRCFSGSRRYTLKSQRYDLGDLRVYLRDTISEIRFGLLSDRWQCI